MFQFTNYLGISLLTAQRPGPAPCCRSLWGGARGTRRRSPSTWSPGTWSQRLWRLLWRLTEAQYPCSLSDADIRAFSPLTTDHTALSLLSRQNHSGVRTHWNRSHRPLKTTSYNSHSDNWDNTTRMSWDHLFNSFYLLRYRCSTLSNSSITTLCSLQHSVVVTGLT